VSRTDKPKPSRVARRAHTEPGRSDAICPPLLTTYFHLLIIYGHGRVGIMFMSRASYGQCCKNRAETYGLIIRLDVSGRLRNFFFAHLNFRGFPGMPGQDSDRLIFSMLIVPKLAIVVGFHQVETAITERGRCFARESGCRCCQGRGDPRVRPTNAN